MRIAIGTGRLHQSNSRKAERKAAGKAEEEFRFSKVNHSGHM